MTRRVEKCQTCKAESEVRSVEEDPSDKDRKLIKLVCGHTIQKMVKVADKDTVGISEKASWLLLKDPVAEIQKAVKDNDSFKTVTYACAIFEYCGKQILVWHSRKSDNALPQNIDRWDLWQVIDELLSRGLITDTDATKLHCIRDLRNSFIHREYSLRLSSAIAEKVDASIEDIINYTRDLKAKYDSMVNNAKK
jgi:hypothetical protein